MAALAKSMCPPDGKAFILKCLSKNSALRPSAQELLGGMEDAEVDPWIRSVEENICAHGKTSIKREFQKHMQQSNVSRVIDSLIANYLIKSQEAKKLGKLFYQADENKDGMIDRDEF